MPEGPELFYLKTWWEKKIVGQKFTQLESNTKSIVRLPKSATVKSMGVKGKVMWIETATYYLHIHLGLSGWIVTEEPKIYKYAFTIGGQKYWLSDRRRFSKLTVFKSQKKHQARLEELGIDFLTPGMTLAYFQETLQSRNQMIIAILLDQSLFPGVGNYIKNEALYLARISPKRKTQDLSEKEIKLLYEKLRYVIFAKVNEWMGTLKRKLPTSLKKLYPKKLPQKYRYRVYHQTQDSFGHKVKCEHLGGRKTYYVPKLQK